MGLFTCSHLKTSSDPVYAAEQSSEAPGPRPEGSGQGSPLPLPAPPLPSSLALCSPDLACLFFINLNCYLFSRIFKGVFFVFYLPLLLFTF